jgi:hypothetical protein
MIAAARVPHAAVAPSAGVAAIGQRGRPNENSGQQNGAASESGAIDHQPT